MRSRLVLARGKVRREAERKGKQRGRASRGEGQAEGKGKQRGRGSRGEGQAEGKGKQRGRGSRGEGQAEANGRELRETAYKTEDRMCYTTWETGRGREGRESEHWTRCFWIIQNK